jgi:hypothetical protein
VDCGEIVRSVRIASISTEIRTDILPIANNKHEGLNHHTKHSCDANWIELAYHKLVFQASDDKENRGIN